jgi:hypothetical protein
MKNCEHSECGIEFGKVLDIDTEKVEVAVKERCNLCGKIIYRGSFVYRRKD